MARPTGRQADGIRLAVLIGVERWVMGWTHPVPSTDRTGGGRGDRGERAEKHRGQHRANATTGEPFANVARSPDKKWSRAVFLSSKGLSPR